MGPLAPVLAAFHALTTGHPFGPSAFKSELGLCLEAEGPQGRTKRL